MSINHNTIIYSNARKDFFLNFGA